MRIFDCHIHTLFSPDGGQTPEEAINGAKSMGLGGIIITDHMDHGFTSSDGLMFQFDVREYAEKMKSLRTTEDDFKVLMGIEEGFQPYIIEKMREDIEYIKPDMVINSIHNVNSADPHDLDFYLGKSRREAFTEYLNEIIKSLVMWDDYDVVGHIGYVLRYCPYEDKTMSYYEFKPYYDEIFRIMIDKDKSLEINTSAMKTLNHPLPDLELLQAYGDMGGKLLTLGSDAHFSHHIAHGFSEIIPLIKSYGYDRLTHYENRLPVYTFIN